MSITKGKYNMLVDVYELTREQLPSGASKRTWDYDNPSMTIDCIARGIPASGLRTVGSTERFSGSDFDDVEWVRIKTQTVLDKRHRVGNIRSVNRWGDTVLHWKDSDGNPEYFEVIGVNATEDPFGALIEFEILAHKPDE